MKTSSKKVLTCAVTAMVISVSSGCDTKSNEAAVTPTPASTDATMVDTTEQFQGNVNNSVNKAVSEAANTIKQEAANSEVLSNFDTLHADLEKGVVESKPVSTKLDNGWKEIATTGVRVIDGDTVEVLVDGQQSERVRLVGIDAPESKQEYGQQSKATLEECIAGKPVSIVYKEKDRYSRILGKVMAGNTDCNFYQVGVGSAWHYKQYQNEQPNDDKYAYSDAEKVARMHSNGLWRAPEPEAPWLYRKTH